MTDTDQAAAAGVAGDDDKQYALNKLYLKDASFEAPNTPAVFTAQWAPEVNVNLQTANKALGEDNYEIVLTVEVEAKQDGNTAFLVEVQQAGVFRMKGFDPEESGRLLGAYSPNVLFPFAREAIADLVGKGGFPTVLLQPINFDALYQQQLQKLAQARDEAAGAERH